MLAFFGIGSRQAVVQACSWISECDVPGCAESCILNRRFNDNADLLKDRQYGEDSWQICPELALWVNLTRPGDPRQSTSRKLQGVRPTAAPLCSQELSIAVCIQHDDTLQRYHYHHCNVNCITVCVCAGKSLCRDQNESQLIVDCLLYTDS
jgi:hypothetical protein